MKALLNIKGVVQVRIVDEAFPANGCARLLEIDTHNDQQRIADFIGKLLEARGVISRSLNIVNGAGAHHDE